MCNHCKHKKLIYCEECGKVYCWDCDEEWVKEHTSRTASYPDNGTIHIFDGITYTTYSN